MWRGSDDSCPQEKSGPWAVAVQRPWLSVSSLPSQARPLGSGAGGCWWGAEGPGVSSRDDGWDGGHSFQALRARRVCRGHVKLARC